MFTDDDMGILEERHDALITNISSIRANMFGPTEHDIININNIIHTFIKENRRKIYGGQALDLLLKKKGNTLYNIKSVLDTPDIDFYSHEPVKDLIKICNLLDNAGFSYVMGKEAIHKETYMISVNMKQFCDITYIPSNINKKVPFNIINGYHVVSPLFMSIDYLRMLTDPITSYWRLPKTVDRFQLLLSHYPLNNIINKNPNIKYDDDFINNEYKTASGTINISHLNKKTIDDVIISLLVDNNSCVLVGPSTIKCFLDKIDMNVTSNMFYDIFCHQIISTDYENDIKLFNEKLFELNIDITTDEHQPYFQFAGKSTHFKINDVTFLKIYSSNNKCIPYQNVSFSHDLCDYDIKIGTYSLILKSLLIELMVNRTLDNKHLMSVYYYMVERFVNIRDAYFKLHPHENVFSNSLFKEFSIECVGKTLSPELERKQLIEYRKKTGKKLTFVYEPKENQRDPSEESYLFSNSSGNKIIIRTKKTDDKDISEKQNEEQANEN